MTLLLPLAALLSCSGGSERAGRADRPTGWPRVAILELRLSNLPPQLAAQLRARLFRRLVSGEYRRVVAEDAVAARMRELGFASGCTVGPCLAGLGKKLGVERVITGSVAAHGSSYDVLLTLLETAGGTLLGQVSSRCDVCTFQELEAMFERAIADIHRPPTR